MGPMIVVFTITILILAVMYYIEESDKLSNRLLRKNNQNRRMLASQMKVHNGVYINKNTGELVVFKDLEYVGEL